MISPVEISRQIIRRQNRRLVSVGRESELPIDAKELASELALREIGELSDAVDGGGIDFLVSPRAAQVRLEDRESVIVLLLRSIDLSEFLLEDREVVIGIKQRVLVALAVVNDLTD